MYFFFFKQKTAYEIRLSLVGSGVTFTTVVARTHCPFPKALRAPWVASAARPLTCCISRHRQVAQGNLQGWRSRTPPAKHGLQDPDIAHAVRNAIRVFSQGDRDLYIGADRVAHRVG